MRDIGYSAALWKTHAMNAGRISFVNKQVSGFQSFGMICLNNFVGGMNPHAVEYAIALGAKEVKMGTIHTKHHIKSFGGQATYPWIRRKGVFKQVVGTTIFNPDNEITPEVLEILDLVSKADVILSTGHLSPTECFELVKAAKSAGVKKIVITHPDWVVMGHSVESQVKMAEMGAILEKCYCSCLPIPPEFRAAAEKPEETITDLKIMAEVIRKVGPKKCVMCSDLGSGGMLLHPIEGMRVFIHSMLRLGVSKKDIDIMTKDNPEKLLGI